MDTQGWYRLIAPVYDLCCRPLYAAPRRQAVAWASANGPRVVELCCGTGLNLPPLARAIGRQGHLLGVDFTPPMLRRAQRRVRRLARQRAAGAPLAEVQVLQADAAQVHRDQAHAWLGDGAADAVLISFGLAVAPDWQGVLERAWRCLRPGGRLVLVDNRPLGPGRRRYCNPLLVPVANFLGHARLQRPLANLHEEGQMAESRTFLGGFVFAATAYKPGKPAAQGVW